MPNSAPAGTSRTLTIPRSYRLHKSDFGFTDSDGNAFKALIISSLPSAGTLYYDSNGDLGGGRSAVTIGQTISAADILAGKLTYLAPPGVSGANYDHFDFQVQDDGGTAGGGIDTDQSPNTLTFNLVATAPTPATFGSLIDLGTLSASDGFKIQGDAASDFAGRSVSSAGDVNGDGFEDILIGASNNDGGGYNAGAAYVIFGRASGFGSLIDLTGLSATDGFKIQGEAGRRYAGASVSSAGDINGDGFDDLLIGATGNTGNGAAYVIFGKSGGFGGLIDLTNLTATDGFTILAAHGGDGTGFSLSSAGDVNGDGFDDILVGAPTSRTGGYNAGAAFVIFGKSGGFGASVNLAALSATDGFKIEGIDRERDGYNVSSAGDVNGDGFDDLLVTAPGNPIAHGQTGWAYLIFGKSGGFGTQLNLSSLSATDGFKILGEPTQAGISGISVSSAGDVNGDGFADILVGVRGNGPGIENNTGAAYVIFGKSGGFGTLIDLAHLSAADGFKIEGDTIRDMAGSSVSSAGDVNGDGYADILIGAPGNESGGGTDAGAAYVLFGRSGGFGTLVDLTGLSAADGFKIQGDMVFDSAGFSVSAGDVNGDGFSDVIVGASHNGSGGTNAGAAYVIFGRSTGASPVAVNDPGNATNENSTVNVAVLANDSDPDGPSPSVARINGTLVSAGGSVVLPSGARVKLETNGTLTYDPNGQFNTLTSPSAGETGAVNTSAPDSFTYTLLGPGGGTATVSVTVNGVASAQDHLNGDSSDNAISGTGNGDYFDLSQGGNDTAAGLGGDDGFYFGAAFTAADIVDGGAGTNDQIGLKGDYSTTPLVLGANTITNIEAIVVLPGFSYNITTNDGNVAAGAVLKVQATQLAAGQNLIFNGSAEHDGSFMIFGGNGNDNLTGGDGNDGFYFGPSQFNSLDTINGGAGANDQLALDGNYSLTLGGNVTNVEVLVLLPGPAASPNTFSLTASDVYVPAGETRTIFGVQVSTGIFFNGAGEHDGAFKIYGGSGNDTFTGSDGGDWIFGGGGGDTMIGGSGADIFYYDDASQSTSTGFDRILGFDDDIDKIDLPFAVSGFTSPVSGMLNNASFDSTLSSAFAGLASHQAGVFTASGGDMAGRIFLVVDADGNAGYQAGSDYVIEIVNPWTPIDNPALFV